MASQRASSLFIGNIDVILVGIAILDGTVVVDSKGWISLLTKDRVTVLHDTFVSANQTTFVDTTTDFAITISIEEVAIVDTNQPTNLLCCIISSDCGNRQAGVDGSTCSNISSNTTDDFGHGTASERASCFHIAYHGIAVHVGDQRGHVGGIGIEVHHGDHILNDGILCVGKHSEVGLLQRTMDTEHGMTIAFKGSLKWSCRGSNRYPDTLRHIDVVVDLDGLAAEVVGSTAILTIDHRDDPSQLILGIDYKFSGACVVWPATFLGGGHMVLYGHPSTDPVEVVFRSVFHKLILVTIVEDDGVGF